MTKEELEKATGQELIEQRNYCGADGYYGDYLDDVNAEMLKRFNRLEELEKENAELKEEVKNNEDLATVAYLQGAGNQKKKSDEQLAKAESLIVRLSTCFGSYANNIFENELLKEAEQYLDEVSE